MQTSETYKLMYRLSLIPQIIDKCCNSTHSCLFSADRELPKSEKDWTVLLQQQQQMHSREMQKWRDIVDLCIQLIKQVRLGQTPLFCYGGVWFQQMAINIHELSLYPSQNTARLSSFPYGDTCIQGSAKARRMPALIVQADMDNLSNKARPCACTHHALQLRIMKRVKMLSCLILSSSLHQMNIDCRQLSSWKGRVDHVVKLQAQCALRNVVLWYIYGLGPIQGGP